MRSGVSELHFERWPRIDDAISSYRLFHSLRDEGPFRLDGAEGVRKRAVTASRHLDDFGAALYCGFGRQPGEDGRTTLQEHRATLDAFLRWREGVPEPA